MRFIPTRIHGAIDYLTGLALIMAPFVLGFADNGPAQWVPMILGAAILITSLMTDYELSLGRLIPMRAHLGVDAAGGLLLAASPWLFGFADQVHWPHVIVGLFEIAVALTTIPVSGSAEIGVGRDYG
ncbi:SPW repeat protein [Microvirga sp. HBU67558]|uniref:SPW repeat domain-containing protein n=1 Tax=Microvirga TaxID=186650 RepID=UPI001B371193|nr:MULTISPECIES: SPW repeat protein [unclassified Microvirga]MBQ0824393.1 SPW repeat protein [Microvirga sp. HBU67558]